MSLLVTLAIVVTVFVLLFGALFMFPFVASGLIKRKRRLRR